MSTSSHNVCAFVKSRDDIDLPDFQIISAPFSLVVGPEAKFEFERDHGMQMFGNQLKPESRGSVMIRSADPAEQPEINPNFLDAEIDRRVHIDGVRFMRRLFAQEEMQPFLGEETYPGDAVESDDEILAAVRQKGAAVFHAAGTCKMGEGADAVLDSALRVRGVTGLRVADASVMPTLVSGNTNAAVMAIGWRASDMILADP